MKSVLFVCTGNSCRSVMAQGLLQQRLKQLEHRLQEPFEVASAGVFAVDGMSPSKETLRLLHQEGVDLSAHMAKNLTNEMVRHASLILAMEQMQRDEILRRVPETAGKTFLLRAYGLAGEALGDPNIPDPIGKPRETYEVCFEMIREAVERVAQACAAGRV